MVKIKIEVGTLVETRWGTLATVEAVNGDMLTVRFHHEAGDVVAERWIAHFKPVTKVEKIH